MSHFFLRPPNDAAYLTQDDVLSRIQSHFTYHECDAVKGAAIADLIIKRLRHSSVSHHIVDSHEQYRRHALMCRLSDKPPLWKSSTDSDCSLFVGECYVEFLLWPKGPLLIAFRSSKHANASRHLLERLADILKYQIKEYPEAINAGADLSLLALHLSTFGIAPDCNSFGVPAHVRERVAQLKARLTKVTETFCLRTPKSIMNCLVVVD